MLQATLKSARSFGELQPDNIMKTFEFEHLFVSQPSKTCSLADLNSQKKKLVCKKKNLPAKQK
jgi:hypothetical protein